MKITIERDLSIMKDEPSNVATVVIDEEATTITDVLDIFERALRAMGYCFDGRLEVVDEESTKEEAE